MDNQKTIEDLLISIDRDGIGDLLQYMRLKGFYTAPCSSQYHLCKEGGLAEHSLNVYKTMKDLEEVLAPYNTEKTKDINYDSIAIVALLHDVGKMGQYGKPNYIENILKSGKKSDSKPYETNKDLLYVPHEVRSLQIITQFIDLTEEEQFAIMYHADVAGDFKYIVASKQRPLQLLLFMADYWSAKVTEV